MKIVIILRVGSILFNCLNSQGDWNIIIVIANNYKF